MTTAEAIERIRAAHAAAPSGWILDTAWPDRGDKYDGPDPGIAFVGQVLDGEFYDLARVDTGAYDQPQAAMPFATYIAACNPEAIGLLLQSHAALLEALSAAQKDAARYQALRASLHPLVMKHTSMPNITVPLTFGSQSYTPEGFDAAIDAAIRTVTESTNG